MNWTGTIETKQLHVKLCIHIAQYQGWLLRDSGLVLVLQNEHRNGMGSKPIYVKGEKKIPRQKLKTKAQLLLPKDRYLGLRIIKPQTT